MSSLVVKEPQGDKDIKERQTKVTHKQKWCFIVNGIISGISVVLLLAYFMFAHMALTQQRYNITQFDNALTNFYECGHMQLKFKVTHYSEYWLIENCYIASEARDIGCGDAVTLVTQSANLSFFLELPALVKSWQLPVSAVLYTPGDDFNATLSAIQYVRNCIPEAELVRRFVSIHIFFPYSHIPSMVPHSEEEAASWAYDCQKTEQSLKDFAVPSFAQRNHLVYPVNIARNLARKLANTYFVIVTEVQFKPVHAKNAVSTFFAKAMKQSCEANQSAFLPHKKLFACHLSTVIYSIDDCLPLEKAFRRIYMLPTYAAKAASDVPGSWEQMQVSIEHGVLKPLALDIPIFISDKRAPIYDERLTREVSPWHNILQMYALCLEEYRVETFADIVMVHSTNADNKALQLDNEVINNTEFSSELSSYSTEYKLLYTLEKENPNCVKCLAVGSKCHRHF